MQTVLVAQNERVITASTDLTVRYGYPKMDICRKIGMPYWEVLNKITIPNNNGAKHALYFLQNLQTLI